jgi:hypothetical protein
VESLEQIARKLTARETSVCLTGLKGAARSAAFAELVRAHGERPILVIGASSKACDALGEDLRAALGGAEAEPGRRVRSFPRHDTLPYERFSPHPIPGAQARRAASPPRSRSAPGARWRCASPRASRSVPPPYTSRSGTASIATRWSSC